MCLSGVVADRFNGAAFFGFFALGFFFGAAGLFVNVGVAAVVAAGEVVGRGFATEVAIDALIVDVKFSRDVVRIFVRDISHKNSRAI